MLRKPYLKFLCEYFPWLTNHCTFHSCHRSHIFIYPERRIPAKKRRYISSCFVLELRKIIPSISISYVTITYQSAQCQRYWCHYKWAAYVNHATSSRVSQCYREWESKTERNCCRHPFGMAFKSSDERDIFQLKTSCRINTCDNICTMWYVWACDIQEGKKNITYCIVYTQKCYFVQCDDEISQEIKH